MAERKRFAKKRPDTGYVIAQYGRVPAVDVFRKRRPAEVVVVKMVRVFGGQLHRVPKERVMLDTRKKQQRSEGKEGFPWQ